MKRPDADMIRKVKKAMGITGGVDDKRLKEVLNMPYFYMSYKPMREFDFATPDDTPHDVVQEAGQDWTLSDDQIARQFAPRAEFVYDEFVLSARNQIVLKHKGHIEQVPVNYWGYVGHREEADSVFVVLEYPDTGEMFSWEGMILEKETIDAQGVKVSRLEPVMAPHYEAEMRHLFQKMDAPKGVTFDGFMSGLNQQALEYYLFICQLMAHLKYGDKHAVEVVPEKPKRVSPALSRDRPWVGATGPRVLLLDRMPTTQSQGTGTHASPKPHRRRGHWKTLSHPRFRHHPKYGKKIYVKPSFVGPRQVSYEGNIYRLVEPLDDALA
jgi:hypothetical protein